MPAKTIIAIVTTIISIAVFLLLQPFEVVDTGHRGVKITLGKVDEVSLSEGLYFFNPLTTGIKEINVQTIRWDNKTSAYTRDIQQAALTYTVNFNLEPAYANIVYQTVGKDWENALVPQIVEGTLKNVIGQWDAVDLIANRGKATLAIETAISEALKEKHILVTKFEITGVDYNDEFEKAVEAKVTAIQHAAEAQNKTVQITEEAKQRIIAAEAEAKSMRIRSDALSQNQNLVSYEAVQKWNGVLPVYMMGSSIPLINMPAK